MSDVDTLVQKMKSGEITGHTLAALAKEGKLSKSDRRKIVKLSQKEEVELTERQKLRLAVKEKKALPKLSKDDRKRKFGKDVDEEREKEEANFTICLGCRKRGHFVKDCPKLSIAPKSILEAEGPEVCFNCGSPDHTLKNCTKPREGRGSLKFANCFICKKVGHISRDCPENPNGLYPNGGCCHICLLKTHLVRDCPERTEEDKQMAALRRQKAEDDEKGVRIKGLTDDAGDMGGDAIALSDAEDDDSDGEDGEDGEGKRSKKKSKKADKDKSHKKQKRSK
jgi:zinc finger CCHC domain-containing protein 9